MSLSRRLIALLFHYCGVGALCRWLQRRDCVVLAYHGVVAPGEEAAIDREGKFVLEESFKRQLDFIGRHYRPVTLEQFQASLQGGPPLPPRSLLLTIDDGYAHTTNRIAPHMKARHIPGAIFVVTGLLGTAETPWPNQVELWWSQRLAIPLADRTWPDGMPVELASVKRLLKLLPEPERAATLATWLGDQDGSLPPGHPFRMMNWDDARRLEADGVAVGSHSVTHAILAHCEDERARSELAESRAALERELGHRVTSFAYPNGGRDFFLNRDESFLEQQGYTAAFSMILGLHRTGDPPFQIRRVPIGREEGWLPLFGARLAFPYRLKQRIVGHIETARGYP